MSDRQRVIEHCWRPGEPPPEPMGGDTFAQNIMRDFEYSRSTFVAAARLASELADEHSLAVGEVRPWVVAWLAELQAELLRWGRGAL